MYDLTNINSLEYLTEFPRIIRQQTGEIPILLVGNKSDLIEERSIPPEQGNAFARINNLLGYIEISAKTGLNCERIFKLLAESILDQLQWLFLIITLYYHDKTHSIPKTELMTT